MQLITYVDESYKKKGAHSGQLIVGGFIATENYWVKFSREWATILNEYKVPYFHFRELNPDERKKQDNPYHGWSNEKTDDFIHALAMIAGQEAVPFGSAVDLVPPGHVKYRPDKWKQAYGVAFGHLAQLMDLHWPASNDPVHFIFDRQSESISIELMSAMKEYQDRDGRFGTYSFSQTTDKTNPEQNCFPLQAADMYAYILRQSGERAFKTLKRQHNRIIDLILGRNTFPKHHPANISNYINEEKWPLLIKEMREHKKHWDSNRKKLGFQKTEYYPQIHFRGYETDSIV